MTTTATRVGSELEKPQPNATGNSVACVDTESPPAYNRLIRLGHRKANGSTFVTTRTVEDETTDNDIILQALKEWKVHWLKKLLMWLFLCQRQVLVLVALELNAIVDLEVQLGEYPVNVTKFVHDNILREATSNPTILGNRRRLVTNPRLLTSGAALHPELEPQAIMLVWQRTMIPVIVLGFIMAAISVFVGVMAGVLTNDAGDGATFAGSTAAILGIVKMCFLVTFKPAC